MTRRLPRFALVVSILGSLLGTPLSVHADPIVLQSGFLALSSDAQSSFGVDLGFFEAPGRASERFSAVGEAPVLRDFLAGFPCRGCNPRTEPAVFRLQFEPTEVLDPSSNSSCPGCGYRADLAFDLGATEGGESRFTMTGTLMGFLNGGSGGRALDVALRGQGMYAATFNRALFTFEADPAPIPEPGTLLLIGSGLAGIAAARRRGRGRSAHVRSTENTVSDFVIQKPASPRP